MCTHLLQMLVYPWSGCGSNRPRVQQVCLVVRAVQFVVAVFKVWLWFLYSDVIIILQNRANCGKRHVPGLEPATSCHFTIHGAVLR